jgi:RNA polymerase subunit RPABC4/transcription elongation factor Spt4
MNYCEMSDEDFICPNCGAEVPARAKACPECGADEKTGWSDQTIYDGTGIEEPEDFDYADWQRREGVGRPTARRILVWVGAVLMLALFVVLVLR